MRANYSHVPVLAERIQQSLDHMPVRSSAIVKQIVRTNISVSETSQDVERYVYDLLTREERKICDMATD